MTERQVVCCHGPNLALLLLQTACGKKQKGLLLGTVIKHVETSMTDENEANEEKKTVVYIEHCVPVSEDKAFGPNGELYDFFFENYVNQYKAKIVGWYSFRRNVKTTVCALQEKLIHDSLLSKLDVEKQTFVLALLSASTQESLSTHSFSKTFLRYNHQDAFEHIRLKISNLSDKVGSSSGYQRNSSYPVSTTFDQILNSTSDDHSVTWVKDIQRRMAGAGDGLCNELMRSEDDLETMRKSVKAMLESLGLKSTEPGCYVPSHHKEKLPLRILSYNPDVQYGENTDKALMQVSDDEEMLEETKDMNVEELANSIAKRYSQLVTDGASPIKNTGGGDSQSPKKEENTDTMES